MKVDAIVRQRALGAVLGSAAGDALGARFEFGPPGAYAKRFPTPVLGGIGEQVGGGGFEWAPGEFTDDTQMAVIQGRSLLACDGVEGANLFARLQEWAHTAKDVGASTSAVLRSGLPWRDASASYYADHPSGSAGNGALMRVTPSAVYFARHDLETSMHAARTLSSVTHGDPAAQWGTALYHAMLHAAIRGDDTFTALAPVLAALPDDQQAFGAVLAPDWQPAHGQVSNGSVWGCLAQAVWAVRTTRSFGDALVAAIQLGHDTDTVAAVTGGLAGAIYGIQAIPSRWTTYLHGYVPGSVQPLRRADLLHLTLELLGSTVAPEQEPGEAIGPTEIASGLYAANLAGAATVAADRAVISLCRVGDTFAGHPVRREIYLTDQGGDHNAGLTHVVRDALDTIDAFLAEGRTVVVHCHGGVSRTGLVLRAWLMRTHGCDEPTATRQLRSVWPTLGLGNATFTELLRTDWSH